MTKKHSNKPRKRNSPAQAVTRRVTIRDVARACGLVPSTVSNALSNRRYVSEATRRNVLAAAEKSGYRASHIARSLRTQRTWSLGVLVGDITNPFFPELVRGVEDVASAQGYNLLLCNTDYRADKQNAAIDLLLDKQVDGIIIASQIQDQSKITEIYRNHVPIVLINQSCPQIEFDYIGVDNVSGMTEACKYLWGLGHRRIGFVLGREGSTAAQDRFAGYERSMQKLAGGYDKRLVQPGDFTYASGVAASRRMLAMADRPTAIIGANDLTALGVIEACSEFGLRVPDDMSVMGIDDIFVSSMPWANLTTLRHPKLVIGATAARLLIDRIGNPDAAAHRLIIPTEFVIRGTTRECTAA